MNGRLWICLGVLIAMVGMFPIAAGGAPKNGKAKQQAAKAKADSEKAADDSSQADSDSQGDGKDADAAKASGKSTVIAIDGGEGAGNEGPLYHQILHQAFLATAREEFGAPTADAALRENMKRSPDKPVEMFQVFSNFEPPRVNFQVTLNRMQQNKATEVWKKRFTIATPANDALEQEVKRAEEAMHKEFFDAFVADGLKPQPHTWKDAAAVPDDVQSLLDDLTIPSQFASVRKLHTLLREDAESPERLSALARAYANLGMMTEYFWTVSTKSLTARALLYAERLCAKQPDSPAALWCRGYVRALAGRPQTALADFEAAGQQSAKDAGARPGWATVAEAYCKYDEPGLKQGMDNRYAPLARWLYFSAVESSRIPAFMSKVVDSVLEKSPDAYRAIDVMAGDKNDVDLRKQGSEFGLSAAGKFTYGQLATLPDLPATVLELCRTKPAQEEGTEEYQRRSRMFSALRAADGYSAARGEPSWGALATLMEDVALVQVGRSLSAGESAESDLDNLWPLVEDHPYGKLLKAYSNNAQERISAEQDADKLKMQGLTANAQPLLMGLCYIGYGQFNKFYADIFHRADCTFRDQWQTYQNTQEAYKDGLLVDQLRRFFPHMPVTVGGLLVRKPDLAAPHVQEWQRQYADNPDVVVRLGRYYRDADKPEQATEIWLSGLKEYPDQEAFTLLAGTYLDEGNEARWLAAWDDYFDKLPDHNGTQAQIADVIAWHFMRQRRWEKAWPYAQRAVEAGGSAATRTEACCAEALEKWDTANEGFSDASHDSDLQSCWYWFCRRTGCGNIDQARQAFQEVINAYDVEQKGLDPYYFAVFYLLDRRFDDAQHWMEQIAKRTNEANILMCAALLADRLNKPTERDNYLRKVLTESRQHSATDMKRPAVELILLAELITDDLAAGGEGKIDFDEAARRAAGAEAGYQSGFWFYLGDYFEIHNQRDQALKCFQRAMLDPDIDCVGRTLAGARLNDAFVSTSDYRAALQVPLTRDEFKPTPLMKLRHPPDATEFNGHYYKFVQVRNLSWSQMKSLAESMGGYMACITSEEEQKFVAGLCSGKNVWLGGYREEGHWKWVSGETFDYEHWAHAKIGPGYVRLLANGEWGGGRDFPDQAAGFVCEWEK